MTTTHAKAKQVRPYAEKIITKGRRGDLHARRLVLSKIGDNDVSQQTVDSLIAQGRAGQLSQVVDVQLADGLSIMEERAQRLGGKLRIESEKGEGTRVELTYKPLNRLREVRKKWVM